MLKEKPKRTERRRLPIVLAYVAGIVTGLGLALIVPPLVPVQVPDVTPRAESVSFSGRIEHLPVLDIALSSDGHTIAAALQEADGTASIYLRDIQGMLLAPAAVELASHIPMVGDIEFTPDDKRLIASPDGSPDNHTVLSINVNDKTTWNFQGDYAGITKPFEFFDSVVVTGGNTLTVYNASTGQLVGQQRYSDPLAQIAANPVNGALLAAMVHPASGNSEVQFLGIAPASGSESNPSRKTEILPTTYQAVDFLPEGNFKDIVFSPQGDRIVAAVDDKLLMHNLALPGATFGGQYDIGTTHRLAVVNDWLAIASDQGVKLLHYETRPYYTTLQWMPKTMLTGYGGAVTGLAFFNDGIHLLTGAADGTLQMWEFATGTPVWKIGS